MNETAKNISEADLSSELLQYYDDFASFNDDCAFLCDAFANLAANSECLDERSSRGLERHAYWLKRKVSEFKDTFKQIRSHHSSLPG